MKTIVSIADAIKDGDSINNQKIKQKFVAREVYCNVNSLVEYCLKQGFEDPDSPVNLDDIENYYTVNWENVLYTILQDWDERQTDLIAYANDPDTFNRRVKTSGDFEVFFNSLDEDERRELCEQFDIACETEPAEIFEWWAVSDFLYENLKKKGCTVVDTGSCKVWGRQTTGQAIILDYVITEICAEMGILDGQANSWANHVN